MEKFWTRASDMAGAPSGIRGLNGRERHLAATLCFVSVRASAVIFDFNGTLSADEHILYEIFAALFAAQGRPPPAREYFDDLAGLSDPEIVRHCLGPDHPAAQAVIETRIARYRDVAADGSTVSAPVREAVWYAAGRVPVAVVSGAARSEIEPVLEAAGLGDAFATIVPAEDVANGKPDPAGYLRALELLDGEIAAREVVVLEDTEPGVAAAKAAGMRVVAVSGTVAADRLARADAIARRLDVE